MSGEQRKAILHVLAEQGVTFSSRAPIYRRQVQRFHEIVADALLAVVPVGDREAVSGVTDEMVERGARALYEQVRAARPFDGLPDFEHADRASFPFAEWHKKRAMDTAETALRAALGSSVPVDEGSEADA